VFLLKIFLLKYTLYTISSIEFADVRSRVTKCSILGVNLFPRNFNVVKNDNSNVVKNGFQLTLEFFKS